MPHGATHVRQKWSVFQEWPTSRIAASGPLGNFAGPQPAAALARGKRASSMSEVSLTESEFESYLDRFLTSGATPTEPTSTSDPLSSDRVPSEGVEYGSLVRTAEVASAPTAEEVALPSQEDPNTLRPALQKRR